MIPHNKFYVRRLPAEQPPYQIDADRYHRFDQRNNLTVGRPNWDPSVKAFTDKVSETRTRRIRVGERGYGVKDYGLFLAAGAATFEYQFATDINQSNRGMTAWQTPRQRYKLEGVPRWEGTPEDASAMVKRAARLFGADLVGIAPLNPLWIYSHAFWEDGTHKEIVFDTADTPTETDTQLIIPRTMKWVIVMGKRMNVDNIAFTPSPVGCAETHHTYGLMALLVSTVAQFLRQIGYQAIPALNDLGLNVPMAIDAGFGEQGRNGKLITPEFGPSVRLCKVITDLPLARDYPIRFGVGEFCKVCRKCADECPSNAIPKGERTWSGPNISNNPGQYTWHLNHESCRRYWAMGPGDNCTICIRSCPFTKKPGGVHDLTRAVISFAPVLNPVWRNLDDLLGYGKQQDTDRFWNG